MEMYKANDNRYADMAYRRCGRSGLLLPVISLGLWHNFGSVDVFSNFIQIMCRQSSWQLDQVLKRISLQTGLFGR